MIAINGSYKFIIYHIKTNTMLYTFSITSNESDDFKVFFTAHQGIKMSELHQAIQKALDYDPLQMASFFICDKDWQKETEITLMEMDESQNIQLMEEVTLGEVIQNDEQNILYLFDFFSERYFFLSLISIDDNSTEETFSMDVSGTVPPQIQIDSENLDELFTNDDSDWKQDEFDDDISFENIDDLEDY